MHIAIIGGGVTGCSVAWHLAGRDGMDVTLLERNRLASGTTWHSAGNITWKPADDSDEPVLYILGLLDELEAESGQQTGWHRTGRLLLAREQHMMDHFTKQAREAIGRGFDSKVLDATELPAHHPLISPDTLTGAWLNPMSGRLNPNDLTMAYARAARKRGARIIEDSAVTALVVENGRVTALRTAAERVDVDAIVVCAGLWSRPLLQTIGVELAQLPCEHFYIIAQPQPALSRDTPGFSFPEGLIYGREEVGGLLCGAFDQGAKVIDVEDLPEPFAFTLLDPAWEKFAPHFEAAVEIFPALEDAPVKTFTNGPEAFTPDGDPLIGPAPGMDNVYVCTGMNSHGVTLSAAAGDIVADMVTGATPRFDHARYAPDRFGAHAADELWLRTTIADTPSGYYRQTSASAKM